MRYDKFLSISDNERLLYLINIARNCIDIIKVHDNAFYLSTRALNLAKEFADGKKIDPDDISDYFETDDVNNNLAYCAYDFAEDTDSVNVMSIILYAVVYAARLDYLINGMGDKMSSPVIEADVDAVYDSIQIYSELSKRGLVPQVD